MTDLLSIGRSGVLAYRAALSTVGENVVNSETIGYSRRVVNTTEAGIAGGSNYAYRASAVFSGVAISSIRRVSDTYRAADVRFSEAEAGRSASKVQWLQTAENALDDSSVGLGVKLSTVFTSAEALSSDVGSQTNRQAVLTALDEASVRFNATAESLKRAADGVAADARNAVSEINGSLNSLTVINKGLRGASDGSAVQANLQDQRDAMLQKISSKIGIEATMEDDGRVNVTLSGAFHIKLVDADTLNSAFIGLVEAGDGRLSLVASGNAEQTAIFPQSGAIAGLIDAASTIASRRETLDVIASEFTTAINDWNKQGRLIGGAAGGNLLLITKGAADISLIESDPDAIAAASADGVENGNALAMRDLRTSDAAEARWALMISTHAQMLASAQSEASATAAQRDGALVGLDEVTGIDLDVEAAQLLRYQQAYGGSAKIIQVARETIQTILDLF